MDGTSSAVHSRERGTGDGRAAAAPARRPRAWTCGNEHRRAGGAPPPPPPRPRGAARRAGVVSLGRPQLLLQRGQLLVELGSRDGLPLCLSLRGRSAARPRACVETHADVEGAGRGRRRLGGGHAQGVTAPGRGKGEGGGEAQRPLGRGGMQGFTPTCNAGSCPEAAAASQFRRDSARGASPPVPDARPTPMGRGPRHATPTPPAAAAPADRRARPAARRRSRSRRQ